MRLRIKSVNRQRRLLEAERPQVQEASYVGLLPRLRASKPLRCEAAAGSTEASARKAVLSAFSVD